MTRKSRRRSRPLPIRSAALRASTYRRRRRWFEKVKNQILSIHHRRQVYREVMAMVDANPALQVPSAFYTWMRTVYVYDTTMAIRRLIDRDRRVVSFVKLMTEIADHPEVMTRRRFVARYPDWLRTAGHKDFERFASPAAQRVHRRIIGRHQRELVASARRLKRFVDKHVAHNDRRPMRRLPTYADLDHCVDLLGRLVKDYTLLLEQKGLTDVEPIIQYDWKAPFRVPWIQSPTLAKSGEGNPVAIIPISAAPRTANAPWFVDEVLRDEEWLRDPTEKARRVAREVIEEFSRGDASRSE
jgi:hypothetical protein